MTVRSVRTPPSWTPLLRWAFILIIAVSTASSIFSIYEMWNIQNKVRQIEEHALGSIELVSRLSRSIDRGRLLFDAHIAESDLPGMKKIEDQIATVDAHVADLSRAYEPTIDNDTERAAWHDLQSEIMAVRPETDRILSLSRRNQDTQARAEMERLVPQFGAIDQSTDNLIRLNRANAEMEVSKIRGLHRTAVILLVFLTILWTLFVLLTARWVTRLVKEREDEMREATAQLEERNRELDAFAGRVAHDLRGPLTAINLAASVKNAASEEKTNAIFRRGVAHMETIIQDLLTLSRISAKTPETRGRTASVAASLEEDLRPKVEGVNGVLHVDVAPATVSCSEGLLRQVLWNLGENALKYRREGVQLKIDIRGSIVRRAYEFVVSDNGTGISQSEAQHVFEPFYRGERQQSTSGTGLGLSIVKRVVEASGGSISFDSIVGQGTTFKIHLPLAISKAA
jgi:signal transduction histidine kinase